MKRRKVYNLFQINLILLVVTATLTTPIILVFSYIIDFHKVIDQVSIILISLVVTAVVAAFGAMYVVMNKERNERKVKVSYPKEFSALLVVTSFGILGIGILFLYLNGPMSFVPNIIIPLFIFSYSLLFYIGEKYFNVRLLRK